MIIFDNVRKSYKGDFWKPAFPAVQNLSFKVNSGSITGFLGANGSGKTTSLKMMLGITSIDEGSIAFEGLGTGKREIMSKIGYMPERPYFYPELSGLEFAAHMASLYGMARAQASENIQKWAAKLDLQQALGRKVRSYSKGMLQRLGLISALVNSPKLLVLDEPVSGMDPGGRSDMKEILLHLNQTEGITIFFSTHILSDVEEICDDIIVLKKGKLEYAGGLDAFMDVHSTGTYVLSYAHNGPMTTVTVQESELNDKIAEVLASKGRVLGVAKKTKSLEKIIYGSDAHESI